MSIVRPSSLALLSIFALSLSALGCGGGDTPDDEMPPTASIVTALTDGKGYSQPVDSVPDSSASAVYFIAQGSKGPAVLRVPGAGGAAVEIFSGAPLVDPHGIAISTDDKTIYIADRAAGADSKGGVLAMPADGGAAPAFVSGTESTGASALEVISENGADQIYFTEAPGAGCNCAAAKVLAVGGTVTALGDGKGLVAPDGIAITAGGDVYVADRGASGAGAVYKISGGATTAVLTDIVTGDPAGIALTSDDSTLLVSSQNAKDGSDQVILVNTAAGTSSIFTDVVGQNHNDSGGVHRAKKRNIFSWCGKTVGGTGSVYQVNLE